MSVYMLVDVDVHNKEEYKKYMEIVKPMIEDYDGVFLIRDEEIDALETSLWRPTRIVLVRFPNKELASNWYNSEEYRPYKKLRLEKATSNILFIEGL